MNHMKDQIKLIVCLGNPGERYRHTKHNMGFLLADFIKDKLAPDLNWKKWEKTGEYIDLTRENGDKFYIAKPLTYMNCSGMMVGSFANFFKLPPTSILVCFDDLSLDFGKIRIKRKGSSGGQKGMASIINVFSSQNISRLKMGIGPRPDKIAAHNYVLSILSKFEFDKLDITLEKAYNAIMVAIDKGVDAAMNSYNCDDTD